MIRKLKILLFIISLLPCIVSGQQVFDTTISIDVDNTNHEGSSSIVLFDNGYAVSGRYLNRDEAITMDSCHLTLIDQYGRISLSKRFASDSSHFEFYSAGVTISDDYILNLYISYNEAPQNNEFRITSFISIYNNMNGSFFEVVPIIENNNFVSRGMLVSEEYLYIYGESDFEPDGTNKALIARFDLNIEAWQDTIEAIDYLLIEGEEHDHKIMGASILSDGSIIAVMNEYPLTYLSANNLCKITSDLELVWKKRYTEPIQSSFKHTNDSKHEENVFYVTGHESLERTIAKVDYDGNIIWQKFYPIENQETSFGVGIYEETYGNLYMGGWLNPLYLNEPFQAFLSKFTPDGELLWDRFYPAPLGIDAYIYDMVQTPDGGFAMAGSIHFPAPRRGDIWLIKTDSLGNTSLPLDIFTEQNEYWLPLGDTLLLNPIPYGGSGINGYINPNWTGDTAYFTENGEFSGVFTGEALGDYELQFFIGDTSNVSASTTFSIHVYDPTSSVNNLPKTEWKTYPNPASDIINFENVNLNQTATHIKVVDVSGREYANFSVKEQHSLNVSTWQNGVYVYRVYKGNKLLFEGKFLVLHV